MRALAPITFCLLLWACSSPPTEFHKLDIPADKFAVSDPNSPTLQEFYVVSHASESVDSLARMAMSFSKETEPKRTESTFWVGKAFLKETRRTPRDFVEKDVDGGSIQTHGEDWILDITHTRTRTRDCWFLSIKGHNGQSPLDTCVDLSPTPLDSAAKNPAKFTEKP
jgi:hypothetical protein